MVSKKKVLVTGAGGYIGRHVVKKLLDKGIEVIALGFNLDEVDDRATKVNRDIFEDDKNIFENLGSPDICLHMAWKDGFIHNSDSHIENLNLHYRFIKCMIAGGLKHIAVMGTMHEIGYWEGKIDESTPCNPYSLYGISKNSLRQSLEVLLRDKEVIFQWLRAFYICGDDLKNNSIFKKIMELEKAGEDKFPFTTGENKYDFISIDELSTQIAMTISQVEITGIINCCSGKAISLKDKVEEFIKLNNLNIRPEYGVFPSRKYDSPIIYGDNNKIKFIMNDSLREIALEKNME